MLRQSIALAALLLSACDAQASTYDEALSAYSQNRVGEAEAALRKIGSDPASDAGNRGRAYRELARIAWLIDADAEGALNLLAKADSAGRGGCGNARLRGRILQEAGRSAILLAEADALAALCPNADEAASIRLDALEAALDLAAGRPGDRARALTAAATVRDALPEDALTGLQGAAASLQFALLAGDASTALQAWKDYFWLTDTDLPQALQHAYPAAAPIFAAGLAAGASADARLMLVDLLVRAGFSAAAERFAMSVSLPAAASDHPLWRKAAAYFEARRELAGAIHASNRRVARGGEAADLAAALERAKAKLMRGAGLSGDPAPALQRAYGLWGEAANTDGFASVHYGHVVQDKSLPVEQYGHRASVAFLALDNMISNGFNSWLWDGTAATGGWTAPGPLIIQFRPEFTSGPVSAWSIFSNGSRRQEVMAQQKELAAADIAALANTDVAYLRGLHDRMQLQVADQIGARAKAEALAGANLRRAFLNKYWQATFQHNMVVHEGRHALDRTLVTGLARLNDTNLEYRAKLSELALADYPRMPFLNINDQTIGGDSAHGKANVKILQAYVDWMKANSGQVRGWDQAAPPLTQLDKLTDGQMRLIARGLDPIAPKSN